MAESVNLKAPHKIIADNILKYTFLIFMRKYTWHFIWNADNSHKKPCLICFWKIKKEIFRISSDAVVNGLEESGTSSKSKSKLPPRFNLLFPDCCWSSFFNGFCFLQQSLFTQFWLQYSVYSVRCQCIWVILGQICLPVIWNYTQYSLLKAIQWRQKDYSIS